MATFRSRGMVDELEDMMVGRMVERGYDPDFAARCFNQIKGFGEYGFPESHAASFAHLVYVSSWLKCHFPAAFAAALLNSQPMGFYAPAQIVRDAREHGVVVLPADVNCSGWDCTLEPLNPPPPGEVDTRSGGGGARRNPDIERARLAESAPPPCFAWSPSRAGEDLVALRLGLRQIDGLRRTRRRPARRRARGAWPLRRCREPCANARASRPRVIERLAAADAFTSLALPRRQALWDARSLVAAPDLPLFAHARARDEGQERAVTRLPRMPLSEEVVADYQTQRLSLKAHPLAFLRASLGERGFVRCADLRDAAASAGRCRSPASS